MLKRGIALTPVKFGISFTATHLNQAGALVHVYTDGSVQLNHGGTEMGQGLNTKVAQVVAEEFGIDVERVRITATDTGKVPNTSATAASSGSDLNGMAAQIAARDDQGPAGRVRRRDVASVAPTQVVFRDDRVFVGNESDRRSANWSQQAYIGARSAVGDRLLQDAEDPLGPRQARTGRPFYYFAYGAACTEVVDRHADRREPGRCASTSCTTSAAR